MQNGLIINFVAEDVVNIYFYFIFDAIALPIPRFKSYLQYYIILTEISFYNFAAAEEIIE